MISLIVLSIFFMAFFISYLLNTFSKEYNENSKSFKMFKICGFIILFTMIIPQMIQHIIDMINKKDINVKASIGELAIWFVCISSFIIALLLQTIEGINKIRGDLNFKIGDILQIYDKSENTKSYKIIKIKYGSIHYYDLDYTHWIKVEEIDKILTKIEKGIIVLKKD